MEITEKEAAEKAANRELYHALKRLNRLMHRMGHQVRDGHKHSLGKIRLLKSVQEHNGIVQKELAELLDIRPSSLTERLGKVEESGFIERRQDEKDQRLMHIYITESGQQEIEKMGEVEDQSTGNLFISLSLDEAATMLNLCNKLNAHLDDGSGKHEEIASEKEHSVSRVKGARAKREHGPRRKTKKQDSVKEGTAKAEVHHSHHDYEAAGETYKRKD